MFAGLFIFFIVVLFLWCVILTYLFVQLSSHYNSLLKNTKGTNLQEVLENVLHDTQIVKKTIAQLSNRCDTIEKEQIAHIQKIGLIRFNPFEDTGGDQSFILALVDGNNTGVVISSLYSRSGTRWYAKKIAEGKAVGHELSDEEKRALAQVKIIKP